MAHVGTAHWSRTIVLIYVRVYAYMHTVSLKPFKSKQILIS